MNHYFFYKKIINQPNLNNEAQLLIAIEYVNLKKIKEFIASGVNINTDGSNISKPLIWAILRLRHLRYPQSIRIENVGEAHMRDMIEIVERLTIAVLLKNSDTDKHDYCSKENEFLLWDNCKIKIEQEMEVLHKVMFSTFSLWTLYKEKDVNKLATMSRNEALKQLLAEPNFKEQYPCFGDKILANFQKGLARAKQLDTAFNSLVSYNRGPKLLPAECWEEILKKLDREDLKSVTKSIFFKEVSYTTSVWNRVSSFVFRTH
ncbi:hypothetical protein [Rickettsiella endosymbiont of Dermanyssus gallinae]|uniref:hypothetical protein n=1 Tax=Rickettsiella endosymbiont of Dermanyssus gallinae TaxID=2856608 RepID=UPI001C52C9E2|nr:hypothetical protein [Rickettsiella endosymbiont of Dermanyssus gallinae]